MKDVSAVLFFPVLIALGCGSPGDYSPAEPIARDTLVLTDSIGVLMGDSNYVFGSVRGIRSIPGGIAFADGIFARIMVFDPSGTFLYSGGGRGEGPGEFLQPMSFCRLSNGDFFVFDFGNRTATVLDDSLDFVTSYPLQLGLPVKIDPGPDSTIVLKQLLVEFQDGSLLSGYRISSMNAYNGAEETVYSEHFVEMGSDTVDLRPWYCFFTADPEGKVYLADYDSDEYLIEVFSPEGEFLWSFEMEIEPRQDYDQEIHHLVFLPVIMPLTTSEGTSTMIISTPEKHPYITGMETDGDGNLWVRRMGLCDSEYWDVVSPEGELLRKVVLYADTTSFSSYPSLHVSPYGMVATRIENESERFYTVDWK